METGGSRKRNRSETDANERTDVERNTVDATGTRQWQTRSEPSVALRVHCAMHDLKGANPTLPRACRPFGTHPGSRESPKVECHRDVFRTSGAIAARFRFCSIAATRSAVNSLIANHLPMPHPLSKNAVPTIRKNAAVSHTDAQHERGRPPLTEPTFVAGWETQNELTNQLGDATDKTPLTQHEPTRTDGN